MYKTKKYQLEEENMLLKTQSNRAMIVIDALIRGCMKKTIKDEDAKKTILIVFQQIFGDAVVIQNSLGEYVKIFSPENGYKVKLLVRPAVAKFMLDTMPIPKEIEICEVDFKKFLEDYRYYKKVVKEYQRMANVLIVPGTSLSAEIFSVVNDADRKIGLMRSIDIVKPILFAFFAKIAYTEKLHPNKEEMMLQRHRVLINYLGNRDYKAKLPELLPQKKIVKETHYCVMCPGSSRTEKCWPVERYVQIANYIFHNYGMKIHLCGGKEELLFEKEILLKVTEPGSIVSHIGATDFSDWSAVVQHADLVIGNDSATMHLAVAARRKAVCIAGVYDKYQFFPYKVDCMEEGDRLPITLIKNMPCEWCRTIGYNAGFGNEKCKKQINEGKCVCCIDAITVKEVIEKINILLKE